MPDSKTSAQNCQPDSHHGSVITRRNGYDIIRCDVCGFAHVSPLPTAEDMAAIYREEYYSSEKPAYLTEAAEDQRWATLMQTDRLASLAGLLAPPRRRLLDIGSGPGFFLQTAMQMGWHAKGIEPSRQAAAFARSLGVEVVEGFFAPDTALTLGRFDVVHLNNVLEHLPDPVSTLKVAYSVLDPGGLLCINVPNDFTAMQEAGRQAANAEQWWVAPPHHLNYFDFATAAQLLERLGLVVVERSTSFPMELFLLMGENYIDNPQQGRACHAKRKAFDLNLEKAGAGATRRAFYRFLAEADIGREVVLIARKP